MTFMTEEKVRKKKANMPPAKTNTQLFKACSKIFSYVEECKVFFIRTILYFILTFGSLSFNAVSTVCSYFCLTVHYPSPLDSLRLSLKRIAFNICILVFVFYTKRYFMLENVSF